MRGLIHVYTGDGKGKTSAAIGVAVRAYGSGMNVRMTQFLKSSHSGELETFKELGDRFELMRGKSAKKFVSMMSDEEKAGCREEMKKLFACSVDSLQERAIGLLILDEALGAIKTGMIDLGEVLSFLGSKPEKLEVVLTGRDASTELIELADYVTDFRAVKHPIDKGISPRKGIEF
ncbi:MAG: cob(I)yrinic acid a,c-diamide adenosyltransferase [Oscillospiraceae bacterium]|nr:cob(I)yrinic acid a,c-diamide adenosyltransferase [Oscillospiraceae bacterium]